MCALRGHVPAAGPSPRASLDGRSRYYDVERFATLNRLRAAVRLEATIEEVRGKGVELIEEVSEQRGRECVEPWATPIQAAGRRRPRRAGRATKDAERRALAKAHAAPSRPLKAPRPGFAVLHADGGARGAPGPAAIGYLLDDEAGVRLAEHAEMIGTTGAAKAEYRALLAGLTRAHELGLGRVIARSDSRLLIAHANGERRHPQRPPGRARGRDHRPADADRHRALRVDPGDGHGGRTAWWPACWGQPGLTPRTHTANGGSGASRASSPPARHDRPQRPG